MPLDTNEIDLNAAYDEQTEQMDEYAEAQAQASPGSDAAIQAAQNGQQAERLRGGLAWALDTWDAESVTLAALTSGERHRVHDTVEGMGTKIADTFVAAGTYDAPYLAHDPMAIDQGDFEATVRNVVDLHPAFVDWAFEQIRSLSRMEVDTGKSYRDLVLEKRNQRASQTENG